MDDIIPLLKHNPTAQRPDVLEAITVQRQPLIADLVDAALDTDGGLRHHLLVGPRGSGKSHIVALVAHRVRQAGRDDVVLAQLVEDPWGIRTYGKLIASIVDSVAQSLGDDALAERAAELRAGGDASEGEALLRATLGQRRLILLVENLDDVYDRIGKDGQASLRAFAENWRQMLVIATTPQLFAGVRDHASPFYGFFRITHLDELTLNSAAELLRQIAALRQDDTLARFLESDIALARLRAVEALAGGHPRVWLLLAGCVSVVAIDELVPLFLEALDELTPYYQDRLRELGRQQQEIVMLLSESGGAMTNRELADRSGLAQNTIASRMAELAERGYVRRATLPEHLAAGDKRMTYWELREPLMRLCLDVKQSRGKPLRVIVEFLRAWYGNWLLDELARLPTEASLATRYATEAFEGLKEPMTLDVVFAGTPAQILERVNIGLRLRPGDRELTTAQAALLSAEGRDEEARGVWQELLGDASNDAIQLMMTYAGVAEEPLTRDESVGLARRLLVDYPGTAAAAFIAAPVLAKADLAVEALQAVELTLERDPGEVDLHILKVQLLSGLGRRDEAIMAAADAVSVAPDSSVAHGSYARCLAQTGRLEDALRATRKALDLAPHDARLQHEFAHLNLEAGKPDDGLPAALEATRLDPTRAQFQFTAGQILRELGRLEEAATRYARAAEIEPDMMGYRNALGLALSMLGRHDEAIAEIATVVETEPDEPLHQRLLGVVSGAADQADAAAKAYRRSIELAPDDPRGRSGLALAALHLGQFEEALEQFVAAARLEPDNAAHWSGQVTALCSLRRVDEALEPMRATLRLDPQIANHHQMAWLLRRVNRADEALEVLTRAIARDDATDETFGRRAHVLLEIGGHDEAREFVLEALVRFPESGDLHNFAADEYRVQGDYETAEEHARAAIALDAADPMARFTFAEIALARDDDESALERLAQALDVWTASEDGPAGEPELLCRILWARGTGWSVATRLVDAYAETAAVNQLATGLTRSVSLLLDVGTTQAKAEAWFEAWRAGGEGHEELTVALAIVQAAVRWKADGDRAHLLALPAEQRAVLVELLDQRTT